MLQIRRNIFETNSSSVHSMAIPKHISGELPKHLSFHLGEWGWESGELDGLEARSYLYTAICQQCDPDIKEEYLDRIKSWLDEWGIKYHFDKPRYSRNDVWNYLENGDIAHGDLVPFIEGVLKDKDSFKRFLLGGVVYTGNDNDCYNDDDMCWIGDEPNHPKRDNENYEYYFKGN